MMTSLSDAIARIMKMDTIEGAPALPRGRIGFKTVIRHNEGELYQYGPFNNRPMRTRPSEPVRQKLARKRRRIGERK